MSKTQTKIRNQKALKPINYSSQNQLTHLAIVKGDLQLKGNEDLTDLKSLRGRNEIKIIKIFKFHL